MTKLTRPKIPKFSTLIVSERQKEILAAKIMNLPVETVSCLSANKIDTAIGSGLFYLHYYKLVDRIAVLEDKADKPLKRLFFCPLLIASQVYGGLCGESRDSPEPCPGTATYTVPPPELQFRER